MYEVTPLNLISRARTAASRYERFEVGLAYIAGFIVLIMAVTTFYEVIARYVFNAPTPWSFELNMNLLLYFALLGGAYTLVIGGHVRVDVFYTRFSPRRKAAVDMVTFVLVLLFLVALVWSGIDMCKFALEVGERSMQALRWPLFPRLIMIPIGGVLVGLQVIIHIIRDAHFVFSASSGSGES